MFSDVTPRLTYMRGKKNTGSYQGIREPCILRAQLSRNMSRALRLRLRVSAALRTFCSGRTSLPHQGRLGPMLRALKPLAPGPPSLTCPLLPAPSPHQKASRGPIPAGSLTSAKVTLDAPPPFYPPAPYQTARWSPPNQPASRKTPLPPRPSPRLAAPAPGLPQPPPLPPPPVTEPTPRREFRRPRNLL